MSPLGSAATEGMDRPCASYDFTSMRESLGNEIFLSNLKWDASAINDERIAPLQNDHVFIVFM